MFQVIAMNRYLGDGDSAYNCSEQFECILGGVFESEVKRLSMFSFPLPNSPPRISCSFVSGLPWFSAMNAIVVFAQIKIPAARSVNCIFLGIPGHMLGKPSSGVI